MAKGNLIFYSTLKKSHPEPVDLWSRREGCHISTKLSMTPIHEQLFSRQTGTSQ